NLLPLPGPNRGFSQRPNSRTSGTSPPESEWFANIESLGTRPMYQFAIRALIRFTGIREAEEFRIITRARIAWRKSLVEQSLAGAIERRDRKTRQPSGSSTDLARPAPLFRRPCTLVSPQE